MKVKVDENLPAGLAELLRAANHDVATVPEEALGGAKDPILRAAVTKEDRLLMTFDVGFGDIRKYPLGSHAGIVVFRLTDQRWRAMEEPARRFLESGLLERLRGGLAVVTESRIRTRLAKDP
jgi:predicted nuclease of predicted toxin-antitoxin system